MGYSLEIKAHAKALFVEQGMTFEEVAKDCDISLSTLKQWGKEDTWTEERRSFEKEFLSLNSKVQRLKVQLLEDATKSLDPQKIYALSNLLRATSAIRGDGKGQDRAGLFIQFLEKFLAYLQEKDSEALRYLQPHIRGFAELVKEG